jgi:uncharacterized membrane protein YoaK (UPF0700 family)
MTAASMPASSNPGGTTPQEELRSFRSLLIIACVFAVAGGYLDAYSYLAHGHVFANAQTGNVVFFSVYASAGQWAQAVRYLPPIAAFALGVSTAQLLGVRPEKRTFRATLLCEIFELAILTALTFVGSYISDRWIVPIISFVAAIQNTSFGKVGPWSFNSAMTTGNIRDAASGFVLWIAGRDPAKNRGRAIALGLICTSFLIGGFSGASYTRLNRTHALGPCAALVAIGVLFTWRERRTRIH